MNGFEKCAECRMIRFSLPDFIRSMMRYEVSFETSPCRTCPHQINTSVLSRMFSERPWFGSSRPTERTLKRLFFFR